MTEKPHEPVSLHVLPNSGKVDQLKQDLAHDAQRMTAGPPVAGPTAAVPSSGKTIRQKLIEGQVIAAVSQVYDPEIPLNIYELGLIYDIDVRPDDTVKVRMTLTSPGCPVAGTLPAEVQRKIAAIDDVKDSEVELVWEPAWDKSRLSEAALLQLGML